MREHGQRQDAAHVPACYDHRACARKVGTVSVGASLAALLDICSSTLARRVNYGYSALKQWWAAVTAVLPPWHVRAVHRGTTASGANDDVWCVPGPKSGARRGCERQWREVHQVEGVGDDIDDLTCMLSLSVRIHAFVYFHKLMMT